MSPLSQIAKLPCLLSASKPAEIVTLSPLSPIKWGFHVSPLKTSHQYLPVCSWILQNVASASILEFWKSASYISSFVSIYPSSLALTKAATLSFSFLSHLDSGLGKMTLLFSCSSSAILIPLPLSLSLFQSWLLPTLHSIENTLMSLLLASWQMKWCIFSLYST